MHFYSMLSGVALFFLLNTLLFLPQYAVNGFKTGLAEIFHKNNSLSWKLLFRRASNDPLKVSLDLALMTSVCLVTEGCSSVLATLYLCILIFDTYYEIFLKLYGNATVYNDYETIVLGAKNYFLDFKWSQFWQPLCLFTLIYLVFHISDLYFRVVGEYSGNNVRILFPLLSLSLLSGYLYKFGFRYNREITIQVQLFNLAANLIKSIHSHLLSGFRYETQGNN